MNPEHVKIVRQGREAIDAWRRAYPDQQLDLSQADVRQNDLSGANLHGADLSGAPLRRVNLAGAILFNASLHGADLTGASLTGADIHGANLFNANLLRANLTGAILFHANLHGADLTEANLHGADLTGASLTRANLTRANLTSAVLEFAVFRDTDCNQVRFSQARFGVTMVAACDLSPALGLEEVTHRFPSTIGLDTLVGTFRRAGNQWTSELRKFFLNAGVDEGVLDQLPGIIAEVKYYSCFIAYGEPDRGFAERLYQDLGARGVSRWIYAMDSTPGERTQREIGLKRQEAEKFIVLCSTQGLVRDGVLKEIEEQMDEDPDKIIPISLDELWKHPGFRVVRAGRDLKPFLMERNYANFGQGRNYDQGFQRLLRALQRKQT